MEPLRHVPDGHEAAQPGDVAAPRPQQRGVRGRVGAGHDLGVGPGGAQRLVRHAAPRGGEGPGHGHHAVLGHRVGRHPPVHSRAQASCTAGKRNVSSLSRIMTVIVVIPKWYPSFILRNILLKKYRVFI